MPPIRFFPPYNVQESMCRDRIHDCQHAAHSHSQPVAQFPQSECGLFPSVGDVTSLVDSAMTSGQVLTITNSMYMPIAVAKGKCRFRGWLAERPRRLCNAADKVRHAKSDNLALMWLHALPRCFESLFGGLQRQRRRKVQVAMVRPCHVSSASVFFSSPSGSLGSRTFFLA